MRKVYLCKPSLTVFSFEVYYENNRYSHFSLTFFNRCFYFGGYKNDNQKV